MPASWHLPAALKEKFPWLHGDAFRLGAAECWDPETSSAQRQAAQALLSGHELPSKMATELLGESPKAEEKYMAYFPCLESESESIDRDLAPADSTRNGHLNPPDSEVELVTSFMPLR